jgi:protein-S-isoprenylcysteine O-methyltransferase Ste14
MANLGMADDSVNPAAAAWRLWYAFSDTRLYDRLLRLPVALWFLSLGAIFVRDIAGAVDGIRASGLDALGAAQLVSRVCLFAFFTLIAWLTLVRSRPLAQAAGLQPRVSALLGTYLIYGLGFLPANPHLGAGLHVLSTLLLLVGNVFAVLILLRLGRSFSIMAEARGLVTEGPYTIIRHPLYLAEQIAIAGAFIQFASPWAAILVLAQFGFQVVRMHNEESVLLLSFPDYAAYRERTARLIPGLW